MGQKFLDLAGLTAYDKKVKEYFKSGLVDITNEAINALFVVPVELPPNNEIWYTTTDGNVVDPYDATVFGANIISNTYENDKGILSFDNDVTSIGYSAFRNCSSLTSIAIPNSVTSIGDRAFFGCTSLTSITTPNSVTSIGNSSFINCSSITSIAIPNSVTSIGKHAFQDCDALTSVIIPNSVTSIGDRTFYGCSSLTSVTIGNSVTSIGEYAFGWCSTLNSITYEGTQAQWNGIEKGDGLNYYVPATYVQCTDGQVKI